MPPRTGTSKYTLLIPTFNRPESLKRLLIYIQAQGAGFPVHVLDSSASDARAANALTISRLDLDCQHIEFPEDMHPFDKFREGIAQVGTPLCGLCADDDIPILAGTEASIRFLEENPDYSVAHGYYFQFAFAPGQIRLANFTYYTPSYDSPEPLARLYDLMRHYQALTYGTYRTQALLRVFDSVRPVQSILARELLSSALATVYGKVARLPVIFHGRSLGPSSAYQNWHPLEWLLDDADGLFREYRQYRDILVEQLLQSGSENRPRPEVERAVDLTHVRYLMLHLPSEAFDQMISDMLSGKSTTEIFRSRAVTGGLIRLATTYVPKSGSSTVAKPPAAAHAPRSSPVAAPVAVNAPRSRVYLLAGKAVRRLDPYFPALTSRIRRMKRKPRPSPAPPPIEETAVKPAPVAKPAPVEQVITMPNRRYVLSPGFVSPPSEFGIELDSEALNRLVQSLEDYR